MANQQLLFLPRPLPDSAFNRLFEPIRVKCALDTGRVLIDETSPLRPTSEFACSVFCGL